MNAKCFLNVSPLQNLPVVVMVTQSLLLSVPLMGMVVVGVRVRVHLMPMLLVPAGPVVTAVLI